MPLHCVGVACHLLYNEEIGPDYFRPRQLSDSRKKKCFQKASSIPTIILCGQKLEGEPSLYSLIVIYIDKKHAKFSNIKISLCPKNPKFSTQK